MEGSFSGLVGKVRHVSFSSIGVSAGKQSSMFANLRSAAMWPCWRRVVVPLLKSQMTSTNKMDFAMMGNLEARSFLISDVSWGVPMRVRSLR